MSLGSPCLHSLGAGSIGLYYHTQARTVFVFAHLVKDLVLLLIMCVSVSVRGCKPMSATSSRSGPPVVFSDLNLGPPPGQDGLVSQSD